MHLRLIHYIQDPNTGVRQTGVTHSIHSIVRGVLFSSPKKSKTLNFILPRIHWQTAVTYLLHTTFLHLQCRFLIQTFNFISVAERDRSKTKFYAFWILSVSLESDWKLVLMFFRQFHRVFTWRYNTTFVLIIKLNTLI